MLLHSSEDFIRLNNVGVGLDVIVCLVYILVIFYEVVTFGPDNLR